MNSQQQNLLHYIENLVLPEIISNELNITSRKETKGRYASISISDKNQSIVTVIFKYNQPYIISPYHNEIKEKEKDLETQIKFIINTYREEDNHDTHFTG